MKFKNRTQKKLGHSYGGNSPRGSISNTKKVTYVETKMIDVSKVHFPEDEHLKKNIMRKYENPTDDSPRWKEYKKRYGIYVKLYGETLDGQDGLNCFGFPHINLGEVDKKISDSVENETPPTMSFEQMVEINSPTMITPSGQELHWGHGLTNDFIEKVQKESSSIIDKPIPIDMRWIENSHVFPLTDKLGFTDELWNEPELMEEYMCWCVRIRFDLNGVSSLTIDCPVDTYTNVLLEPETIILN